MAFSHMSDQDVYDLRDALNEYQEETGTDEFTDGALAVCAWLTEPATKVSVKDFFSANEITK